MKFDNMTKEELKIWKMVKARLTADPMLDNVLDGQDEDSKAAAAAATALAESRRRICELLEAKPGTPVLTFWTPTEDEDAELLHVRESDENN